MCHGVHVQVRGQPLVLGSLLPSCLRHVLFVVVAHARLACPQLPGILQAMPPITDIGSQMCRLVAPWC